ncbi:MAG: 4-hydroxythreonine-4-phosphate dehydrogenase PdxA [Propionibacteriaceae bacterium]|jgi:4-hydroxythreonine-4-phosphate dehydrogenase|nr:4-hydroxythreonine-4-phosphate dehydrogenase PdxA [Propionibacteriaceae bacterium]
MSRPVIALTMGDPAGVGPEICVKALAGPDIYRLARPLVLGDLTRLRAAAALSHLDVGFRTVDGPTGGAYEPGVIDVVDLANVPPDLPWGQVSAAAGDAAYHYIELAARYALDQSAGAICTAPINKEALHRAGHNFPGHTELLAHLAGTPEVSMMLTAPGLRVIHVTTHLGLLDAIAAIEPGLVERTIRRGDELLKRTGLAHPRIAVCAINPHAGENGLFGYREEELKVNPGVAAARAAGIDAQGALPADAVFYRATRGDFDLVVAMYHDQGHAPVKALGIEHGVNITVGLPIVRTSVDHGTAFDIAGTGRVDAASLMEALRSAVELAAR